MNIVLLLGLLCTAAPYLFSAAVSDTGLPDAILYNLRSGNVARAVQDIGDLNISPSRLLGAKILHPVTAYYARKALAESEKGKEILTAEALRQYYKKEDVLSSEVHEAFIRKLIFLKYVVSFCIYADLMCITDASEREKAEQILEAFKQKMAYHTSFSAGYLCARTDIEETTARLFDVTINLQGLFESDRLKYSPSWILFCTNSTYISSFQYGSFVFEDNTKFKLRIERALTFPEIAQETYARALQVQLDDLIKKLKNQGVEFPQRADRAAYYSTPFSVPSPSRSIDWSRLRTPVHQGSPSSDLRSVSYGQLPSPSLLKYEEIISVGPRTKPFNAFEELFGSR